MIQTSAKPLEALSAFPNVFQNLKSQENQIQVAQEVNVAKESFGEGTLENSLAENVSSDDPKSHLKETSSFKLFTYLIPIVLIVIYCIMMFIGSDAIFSQWGFLGLVGVLSAINLAVLGVTVNNMPKIKKDMIPCVGDGGFDNINVGDYISVYGGIMAQCALFIIFAFFGIQSKGFNTVTIYVVTFVLMTVIVVAILIAAGIFIKADRCDATEHLSTYNSAYAGTLVFTMMFNIINYLYVAAACFQTDDSRSIAFSKVIFVFLPFIILIMYPTYLASLSDDDQEKASFNTTVVGSLFGSIFTVWGIGGIIWPDGIFNWPR